MLDLVEEKNVFRFSVLGFCLFEFGCVCQSDSFGTELLLEDKMFTGDVK